MNDSTNWANSISRESFIEDLENNLKRMKKYKEANNYPYFKVSQNQFDVLSSFAYMHGLLTSEENKRYQKYRHSFMWEFVLEEV